MATAKDWTVMVYAPGDDVTQSAVRPANLQLLASAVNHLGKSLSAALANPLLPSTIMAARAQVQEYRCRSVNISRALSIYSPKRTIAPLYGTLDFTKPARGMSF